MPLGLSSKSIIRKFPAAAINAGLSKARPIPDAGLFLDSRTKVSPSIGSPSNSTERPLISIFSTPATVRPVALSVAVHKPRCVVSLMIPSEDSAPGEILKNPNSSLRIFICRSVSFESDNVLP